MQCGFGNMSHIVQHVRITFLHFEPTFQVIECDIFVWGSSLVSEGDTIWLLYQWIKAVETTPTWQSYAIECNRRTHIDNWTLSVLEDGVLEAVIFGSRFRTALTWSIDNLPKIELFPPSNSWLTRRLRMLHVTSEIGQRKSNHMWASWTISQKYTRKGDIGIWNTRKEHQFHNNKHMFAFTISMAPTIYTS